MTSLQVRRHNEHVLRELEEGDLVEFDRGVFQHWGVYIGNEEIVHLTGDGNTSSSTPRHLFSISGQMFEKAIVKKDNFWAVAKGDKAYKNNKDDDSRSPLPREEIVENAVSMQGPLKYNVLWSNCEHFAKWCRYGKKISSQVTSFVKRAKDVAVVAAATTASVAMIALGTTKK